MAHMHDSESAALQKAKADNCWCAKTRKRCGYHEGYEDGLDAADDRIEQLETAIQKALETANRIDPYDDITVQVNRDLKGGQIHGYWVDEIHLMGDE